MQVKRRFADIARGQVHYRYCGRDNAPPLVMLHKMPGSSTILEPLMLRLGQHFRVFAPDAAGHGDSFQPSESDPDVAYYARNVLEFANVVGLVDFALYGLHAGGVTAIEISIIDPGSVRCLVIDGLALYENAALETMLAPGAHLPMFPFHASGSHLLQAWEMVRDAEVFFPWFLRNPENYRQRPLPDVKLIHERFLDFVKSMNTYSLHYRAALKYPRRDRFPLVRVPTLASVGRDDELLPHLDRAAALIPDAQKIVTPGYATDEDTDATARIFIKFIEKHNA